jgi:hypothetical protein
MRMLIDDQVVYDGAPIPIPRVGDTLRRDGDERSVEAVTWDLDADGGVSVTLLLAARPYAY